MIRKIKHPSNRGERLAVKAKKAKIHSNASPVYKLLEEHKWLYPASLDKKEALNADSNPRPRELHP